MSRTLKIELTLPNHPCSLSMARAYADELVKLAELPILTVGPLVDAVVEASANVLEHAFEPDEEGCFEILGELSLTELTISIRDHGLPFDPLRLQPTEATARKMAEGTGLNRIRQAVDVLEWRHLGRTGKELRLIKRRPSADVTEQLSVESLQPIRQDAPLAPEQSYRIERFRPEHALGVCRCFYRVYGNSYLMDDVYYPDRMVRGNETGELVSVVALAEDGEVVGHYALERPRMTRVAERGMLVVSPEHRGRDLMGQMRTMVEAEAEALGLIGVFGVAVTVHTFSQRVNEEFEQRVCGVYLGGAPADTLFRKLEHQRTGERGTWVIYYGYVHAPERTVVHLPERHRKLVERIYEGLAVPVEYGDAGPIPDIAGEIDVTYSHTMDYGTVYVRVIGEDTDSEVCRATRDLCEITGADAVYVEIPLAQPSAPALCDRLEEKGFFFQGIGPAFAKDGDALILAYLHVEVSAKDAKVLNPFARELLDYALAERERVSAGMKTGAGELRCG